METLPRMTAEQFAKGRGPGVWIRDGNLAGFGYFVFENGSRHDSGALAFYDPPEDALEALHLKHAWAVTKREREMTAFDEFLLYAGNQSGWSNKFANLPGPPDDSADQLRRGKARILVLAAKVNALRKQIDELTGEFKKQSASEQLEAQRKKNARESWDAITSVSVTDAEFRGVV